MLKTLTQDGPKHHLHMTERWRCFYDYFKSSNMWRVRVLEQNYIYFWFWGSILVYILQDGSILFLMTADRMNNVSVPATSLLAALALFQLYVDSLLPMLNPCVSPVLSLNLYEILYSTHSVLPSLEERISFQSDDYTCDCQFSLFTEEPQHIYDSCLY